MSSANVCCKCLRQQAASTSSCLLALPVLQQLLLASPAASPPMHPVSLRPLPLTAAQLSLASAQLHCADGEDLPPAF